MATTIEERLARVEARLGEVEASLRPQRPWFAVTSEEAKALLRAPVDRGPEEMEAFRRVYGCFDGPEDLSEHMRDYLYGDRD